MCVPLRHITNPDYGVINYSSMLVPSDRNGNHYVAVNSCALALHTRARLTHKVKEFRLEVGGADKIDDI